jgi:hypothetical protein
VKPRRTARVPLPVLGVLLSAHAVAAEPPRVTLDWRAPAGCPSRDAVLARVEHLLGSREKTSRSAPLEVRELVTLTPDGSFHAELGIVDDGVERSRTLEAATCSEIAEASAVVIALAISPDALAPPPTEVADTMPLLDSPVAAALAEASPPAQSTPDKVERPLERGMRGERTLRPRVGAGIVADLGGIAPLAPGLGIAAGVRYGRYVDFGLRAGFFPERSTSLESQPNQGVRLQLVDVTPALCVEPFELPADLGACALFDLGYLRARGFGSLFRYRRSTLWLAPGGGITAAYPARARFRSRLSADALVPLSRTEFVLTNAGVARRLPAVAPRVGLTLELIFP